MYAPRMFPGLGLNVPGIDAAIPGAKADFLQGPVPTVQTGVQ